MEYVPGLFFVSLGFLFQVFVPVSASLLCSFFLGFSLSLKSLFCLDLSIVVFHFHYFIFHFSRFASRPRVLVDLIIDLLIILTLSLRLFVSYC